MANKKDSKVRDLKAKKDVKGGGIHHSNHPFQQGTRGPGQSQGARPPVHVQGTRGPNQGA